MHILPAPKDFGFDPHKFPGWRRDQERAIMEQYECPKRFLVQVLPTGAGKSLTYMTSAKLHTGRKLFLTSSKGLQDQLRRDFSDHMVTIMGKNNYPCRLDPNCEMSCELGPCRAGVYCNFRDYGCPYWDQVRRAAKSDMVSTNYSYWLMNKPRGGSPPKYSIGDFDVLFLDEAHDSVNNLLDVLSTTIAARECPITWIDEHANYGEHMMWLQTISDFCTDEIKELGNKLTARQARKIARLMSLKNKADMVMGMMTSKNWVIDWNSERVKYDPIWPSYLAEPWLFRDIRKIVLTSATIRPKTMNILGISGSGEPKDDNSAFVCTEYPNHFPIERRPIYYVPTARIQYNMSIEEVNLWLLRIDQILRLRMDRKGIIHTVSYDRCNKISLTSRYRSHFITHESRGIRDTVRKFKYAEAPSVLVSPSVVTGYDFPYDEARYQIVCKIPFPDQRSKVDQERKKIDRHYGSYCAMQTTQQICGRSNRAGDDFSEVFIIDDHAQWFLYKNPTRGFAANWFTEAIQWIEVLPIPPAMNSLGRRR